MKTSRIIIIIAFLIGSLCLFAQDPPPPPGEHGSTGNQDPSGAPIDGGLGILLALGAAYGGYKLYRKRKQSADETPEG